MTQLLGILNVTPDSFSDGGKYDEPTAALTQCAHLFATGATWVDVGAQSTRPHATVLTAAQEQARLQRYLPQLMAAYGPHISLDSYHPASVAYYLSLGGQIINDVSGFADPHMRRLAADSGATCIVNHCPGGDPTTVHDGPPLTDGHLVVSDLLARRTQMMSDGIDSDKIILDPGIGFGKSMELNHALLDFAACVPADIPVLIGFSKKRFLGQARFTPPPNVAAAQRAVSAGAAWLRVHDPEWYAV